MNKDELFANLQQKVWANHVAKYILEKKWDKKYADPLDLGIAICDDLLIEFSTDAVIRKGGSGPRNDIRQKVETEYFKENKR